MRFFQKLCSMQKGKDLNSVEITNVCPLIKMSKNLTVLFFSDTLMDYKSVINYLNQLNNKNIKILVRLKSNQNEDQNFYY